MPEAILINLKQLLEQSCWKTPQTEKMFIKLRENSPQATLQTVTIQCLPSESLIILLEEGQGTSRKYSPLLSRADGLTHNKACDAVILCIHESRWYRLLIELKSDRPKKCEEQFRASLCFLHYLDCLLGKCFGMAPVHWEDRRVVLNTGKSGRTTLDKQPVSAKRPSGPPANEIAYLKIRNDDTLHFSRVLAGY